MPLIGTPVLAFLPFTTPSPAPSQPHPAALSEAECRAKYDSEGQSSIISKLTSCNPSRPDINACCGQIKAV